jgi:hypothetical protein
MRLLEINFIGDRETKYFSMQINCLGSIIFAWANVVKQKI